MQMERANSLTSDDSSSYLELFFSCRKLADLDIITVTDSFLVVKLSEPNKPQRTLLKTKVYYNTLNPDFAETLTIQYFFQIRQKLKISVYHEANPHKLIGEVETTLGQVFGSPAKGLQKPILNNKKDQGLLIIKCQKVQTSTNHCMEFNVAASDLPSGSCFLCFGGSADTFYRIYRKRKNDQLLIYQSQVIQNELSPNYRKAKLSERRLCRNDTHQQFQLIFYHHSVVGNHSQIGRVKTNVNSILDARHLAISKGGSKIASIYFQQINRYIQHSFVDYIYAGLQMHLITCIDFTASNGSPKFPDSLHHIGLDSRSQYQQALEQVSRILLDYDYDKLVPLYGFGAKCNFPTFHTYNQVNHCFPVNGNEADSNVFQVQGIIQAYRNSLMYLQFGGPTLFTKLLQAAISQAKQLKKIPHQYMILFILTDGEIHDKSLVIDKIIECCTLPISIIIVGIGNGSFEIMDELDDDDCQLVDSHGRRTTRDLVQFVEFSKFKNNGVDLAKEVLEELPRQVEQYYRMMNISPMHFRKR